MAWRLALDMGTNSLGWSAFKLNSAGEVENLIDLGVRIFSDGREPSSKERVGESLAVERRLARGARRNRDRRLKRKRQLMDRLITLDLMPKDEQKRKEVINIDPYLLRAKAVTEKLTANELGRVLFHLSQRRGFLSNRKSDGDEESGKIKPKITELRKALGNKTLGQWLFEQAEKGKSIRFYGSEGDFYPDRAMYLDEFDKIREKQNKNHNLSSDDWDVLRNGNKDQKFDGLFYQRPLKPVEKGRCEFFIEEFRAHKDLPISQEFRILQEVGNLQYYDDNHIKYELKENQRNELIKTLNEQKTLSFGGIRKLKNPDGSHVFPRGCLFNIEDGGRDKLLGNATAIEMSKADMLGPKWNELSSDLKNDLLETLHEAQDNAELIHDLIADFALSEEQATAVSKFKLSASTTNLSRKFMMRCAAVMQNEQMRYDEAVQEVYDDDGAFLHHSKYEVGRILEKLPYYGELLKGSVIGAKPADFDAIKNPEQHYGKINNPTVHVALNQLRKLLNCLIDRFGSAPSEIHVELVRDLKKTAKARNDIAKQNKVYQKANDSRAKIFRELHNGQDPSGLDLKKMRLWEELGNDQLTRHCPFSGKVISATMLFNGEAEIEHILPFSRTLDNGTANLTIATRQSNRLKSNQTPYEAFASDQHADQGIKWSSIAERAKSLPVNKRWRFDADAMERFNAEGGFLARQLHDNAYISRTTKRYLSHICIEKKIATIPGGLTALMRGKWHLNDLLGDHNYKERNDHRHHAIDAFVVGLTDRATLQKVSVMTKRGVDAKEHIEVPDITPLRNELKEQLDKIIISYKPDHGTNGKMFKETAYGIIPEEKQDPELKGYGLVTRKNLSVLKRTEIRAIRNKGWRDLVQKHVDEVEAKKGTLKDRQLEAPLIEFGKQHNIKTIRILVTSQTATQIKNKKGMFYKAYAPDSYACVDIWELPKGTSGKWKKGEFEWQGVFWSYADCKGQSPDKNNGRISGKAIHPAAKFITRLFKNDTIEVKEGREKKIMRVRGYSATANKIDLCWQYDTETKQKFISINVLKKNFIRKLYIKPDGSVRG